MSKALEIADSLVSEWHEDQINFDTALNAATELKRLAAIEEKYNAIMAQDPVAWCFATIGNPCNLVTEKPRSHYHPQALYVIKKDE